MKKLAHCPFCGNDKPKVKASTANGVSSAQVVCGDCGAAGPRVGGGVDSKKAAREFWTNGLYGDGRVR